MDVGILREFVVFCRHLNYTAAARELHVAQSTLNRHVHALEQEFGAPLVSQGDPVRLTPMGKTVLESAHAVLAAYDDMFARARTTKDLRPRIVRVAHYAGHRMVSDLLSLACSQLKETHPELAVEYVDIKGMSYLDALRLGKTDVAVAYHDKTGDDAGLTFTPLFEEATAVGIRKTHPLADHTEIPIADIAGMTMLWPSERSLDDWYTHFFAPLCRRHGFEPRTEWIPASSMDEFYTSARSEGVFLFSDSDVFAYGNYLPLSLRATHVFRLLKCADCRYWTYAVRKETGDDSPAAVLVAKMASVAESITRALPESDSGTPLAR